MTNITLQYFIQPSFWFNTANIHRPHGENVHHSRTTHSDLILVQTLALIELGFTNYEKTKKGMTLPTKVPATTSQGGQVFAFQSFLQTFSSPAQTFVINPSRRTTVVGQQGTRLTFYPGSFADHLGKTQTENVTLRLTEVFAKDGIIFSGLPTTCEDRVLESAGQFRLEATANNAGLSLRKEVTIELPIPDHVNNSMAMHLFQGSQSSTRAFRSGYNFDWQQAETKPLTLVKSMGRRYFQFSIDRLNWWNCHSFYKARHKAMLSIKMDTYIEEFEDKLAFLIFKDINSVVRMYPMGHRFSAMHIPTQMSVSILVMAYAKQQLYLGETDILRTSNTMLRLPIYPISEGDLIEHLKGLGQ